VLAPAAAAKWADSGYLPTQLNQLRTNTLQPFSAMQCDPNVP